VLLREEKQTGNELEKLLKDLKTLSEKEVKIAEAYYELEFNSINENKKIYMLKNKANLLQYQLSDFEKCNIMNQLFEISFGERHAAINGFVLSGLWPIESVKNQIILFKIFLYFLFFLQNFFLIYKYIK